MLQECPLSYAETARQLCNTVATYGVKSLVYDIEAISTKKQSKKRPKKGALCLLMTQE